MKNNEISEQNQREESYFDNNSCEEGEDPGEESKELQVEDLLVASELL